MSKFNEFRAKHHKAVHFATAGIGAFLIGVLIGQIDNTAYRDGAYAACDEFRKVIDESGKDYPENSEETGA